MEACYRQEILTAESTITTASLGKGAIVLTLNHLTSSVEPRIQKATNPKSQ